MRRSGQNLRFLANKSPYLSNGARWPRLLLITNRKSYTGSRLPPILMTLDDLKRLNRSFYRFFGDFGLRDTFQERIALKPIEIDIDMLRMKFLALNVNFDGLSPDFQGSRKPAHEGVKERYPRESRYFTVVGQSFVITAGDRLTACKQELL